MSIPKQSLSDAERSFASGIAKDYFNSQPPEQISLPDEAGERMVWWWRVLHTREFRESNGGVLFFRWFKEELERSAYLYELGARVSGEYEFGKTWLKLPREKWEELAYRWPMDTSLRSGISEAQPDRTHRTGWTPYRRLSFNLLLNDSTLTRCFRRMIKDAREQTKIPSPKPNKGRRNRGFSWRPLELMDLQRFASRELNDSERSQVSKAKKEFYAVQPSK